MNKSIVWLAVGIVAVAAILAISVTQSSLRDLVFGVDACGAAGSDVATFDRSFAGYPFPTLEFRDGAGRARSLADENGTPALVNFWATWCPPCVREMPSLQRLAGRVGGELAVLPLSVDREGAPIVEKFYAANKLDGLPVLIDEGGKVQRAAAVNALPTTILVGPDGKEVGRMVGAFEWDGETAARLISACLGVGGTEDTALR